MAIISAMATLAGGGLREPQAGIDYDPDKPMDQDEYEYLTSTGQYTGDGWRERFMQANQRPDVGEAIDWPRRPAEWVYVSHSGGYLGFEDDDER